jgi:hypothetical protein
MPKKTMLQRFRQIDARSNARRSYNGGRLHERHHGHDERAKACAGADRCVQERADIRDQRQSCPAAGRRGAAAREEQTIISIREGRYQGSYGKS